MNLSKFQLPLIRKVFPSLIAQNITGIQPMTNPLPIKEIRHWDIRNRLGEWVLVRWSTYSVFGLVGPEETYQIFDTKQEAISVMVLEQMEQ